MAEEGSDETPLSKQCTGNLPPSGGSGDAGFPDSSQSTSNAIESSHNTCDGVDDSNGDNRALPQALPVGASSDALMQGQTEPKLVKEMNGSIPGRSNNDVRSDGSELSHFISDGDICFFLASTLGIDTVEKFASADRFQIAQRLFSWYEERATKERGCVVANSSRTRPLKALEAQIFSWRLKMNKIRAHHGLPPLPTGGNLALITKQSDGNAESAPKESAATVDGEKANSNEASGANTRKKPSNDAGNKRRKRLPEELSTNKESVAARNILSGVNDLVTALPEEECRFLGSRFWIFTVQQLKSVLAQNGTASEETKMESEAPLNVSKWHLVEAIMTEMTKVAESSSAASNGANIVPNDKEDTAIKMRRTSAEALVSTWKTKIDARRKPSPDDVFRSFSLNGALSILLPPALIQFLNSAGIDTAYDFIAARKTENSLLVALFVIWQEKQRMKTTRPEKAARFLMSVSSRVQSAITSIAPADSFTRAWSGCNLIALTSTARDFIIFHCRYSDDTSFLEELTGNIAKKLDTFRAEKGMPVLKGTGNVAMVSSWRTIVKDTGDLGESLLRPLPIVSLDITAIITAQNSGVGNVSKTNAKASTRGKKRKSMGTSDAALRADALTENVPSFKPPHDHLSDNINLVMHELQSNDFMQRVLKPSQAKFLQSAGISNADQLLRADKGEKSGIVQSLIRWRRDRGFDEIPATSASKAILDWSQKVETELNAIKQKRRKELDVDNEAAVLKNNAAGKSGGGANRSRQFKKKKRVIPKKFQEETGLDPIEALSPTARQFLATLGVTKAEQFLSETTSDLGSAFISWRARTGLDELKGAGAISIVSGWKGQVRDVCEYLDKQSLLDLDATVRKKSHSVSGSCAVAEFTGGASWKERPTQLAYNAPARSSITPPDAVSSGPNVLDKPEDRYVTRPGILNGLPSRNFAVRGNGKDPALYDFQLSVRRQDAANNSSSEDDVVVCLTYRGARMNKFPTHLGGADSTIGDLPHSNASSALPSVLPILSDCSVDGRCSESGEENIEQSHITFCSLAPAATATAASIDKIAGGGLIDLTRFHIFSTSSASSKDISSERYEHAKGQLEVFMESNKEEDGGTRNAEANTQENNKGENMRANVSVVLDPASGEKQYLLCLANPIEKGQTLELVLSNASAIAPTLSKLAFCQDDASDHKLRHSITTLIESMTANEILENLLFLEKKIAIVAEQLEQFEHSSQKPHQASTMPLGTESRKPADGDPESPLISLLTRRRRIHFIASTILRQAKALLKEDRLLQLDRSTLTTTTGRLDKLLWDKLSVEATELIAQRVGASSAVLDEGLLKEVMNELRFAMARQGVRGPRCPLSSQLDAVVSQLIVQYALTTAGSNLGSNQQNLLKEIYHAAQKSARDLHSICTARSHDDILRLILPSEIALDSHRHMSYLPQGMPTHTASSLPNLSFASIGENSFECPLNLSNAQKKPEYSFIVLRADSGFSSTSIALLLDKNSESDLSLLIGALTSSTRRLDLSIDTSWYLHNQIISPADEMSRCGFVSWCKTIHALCAPSYSLKDLTETVVQSLGDMTVDPPDNSVVQSIKLYLPSQENKVLARATRADYFPKTLPIFLRILFPHLEQKFSWKLHCGRSPESLTYIPPETLDKRRKDASFDFTASENRRKKTLRKMQKANVPTSKLPRNLRQIFITFAKTVAKIDENDGLATGDVEVGGDDASAPKDTCNSNLSVPEAAGRPANDAINAFVESIDFRGDDSKRAGITLIGESILGLFDKMIPASLKKKNAGTTDESNADSPSRVSTKPPRESYCCEYLLWWMVLLPDLLAKSGLPLRQQEMIEGFVEALFLYLSRNHSEMFTLFDYSDSIAIDETPTESVDISQLVLEILNKASEETKEDKNDGNASTAAADGNSPNKLADDGELSSVVLREHEKHLLTDYVSHALQQVQLCFLREEDLSSGKRGTFRVGFPGIVCKHCKESKMFYSNVSSLSACPSGIHIHCQRCSRCPKAIVHQMNEMKKLHNQQKKILKTGSMAKFYHSLYKRMMRMRRATEGGAFFDESSSDEQSDEDENESGDQATTDDGVNDINTGDDVFFNHVDAIRSVAEDKFYQRRNMTSAIDLYYQCVERGGLLWKTDALPSSLPDYMVSEWILKLILRRLDRGLPLSSIAPPETDVGASSASAVSGNAPSHSGPTYAYVAASKSSNKVCSVEGCPKHRQSKCDGMCRAHWSEMQRTGVRPGPVNTNKKHGTKRKSSSPSGGDEIQSSRNDAWTCHQCGEINAAETQRCGGCKGWRGGKRRSTNNSTSSPVAAVHSPPRTAWTCHLCGKENSGARQRCVYPCRAWRGGKRIYL